MTNILPVRNVSATFTRPANVTAYASGQLVGNNTVAASVVAMSFAVSRSKEGSFVVSRARIKKSGTSVANASFRLHLYASAPTPSNGDGGVWLTNQAGYLGYVDITVDKAFTDAAQGDGVPIANSVGSWLGVRLAGVTTLFGLLEARGAYTPASGEVFTVTLDVLPVT